MTQFELTFAYKIESMMSVIAHPEYRQVLVEVCHFLSSSFGVFNENCSKKVLCCLRWVLFTLATLLRWSTFCSFSSQVLHGMSYEIAYYPASSPFHFIIIRIGGCFYETAWEDPQEKGIFDCFYQVSDLITRQYDEADLMYCGGS